MSKVLLLLSSWLFQHEFLDLNSPFRLMKKEMLEEILKQIGNTLFAPNIFITILATKKFSNKSIEILHHERKYGINSLNIFNVLTPIIQTIVSLVKLRIRLER